MHTRPSRPAASSFAGTPSRIDHRASTNTCSAGSPNKEAALQTRIDELGRRACLKLCGGAWMARCLGKVTERDRIVSLFRKGRANEPRTVGKHLRRLRLNLKLRQKDVAELIGVDATSVYGWENNRSEPSRAYRPAIEQFLGYDPSVGQPAVDTT